MQFIQKGPQFSQKMSAGNACMLVTFFMSAPRTILNLGKNLF